MIRIVLVIVLTLLASPVRVGATVGYMSRASGFDLNFNGTVGEAGADLAVCDGSGDATSTVGEDIDGNGTADRQVYVNLTSGTDQTTCGLPGSPCRTITYAMAGTNAAVTGGPIAAAGATQIQAICFRGTGRESIVPTRSGATGTYSLAATGNQKRAFDMPRYPLLIAGWDADGDNSYPPHDPDDIAVLDGNLGGTSLDETFDNNAPHSNLEYAHFTARDYGLAGTTPAGFMRVGRGGGSPTQIYVHDIKLVDILRGIGNDSDRAIFNFFVQGSTLTDVNISNVWVTDMGGGYFVRGAGSGTIVEGPYRFQNITLTMMGLAGSYIGGIKLWDYTTGVELLDNDWDANPDGWSPGFSGGAGTYAAGPSVCTQDWMIRGNVFTDFKQFVNLEPDAGSGFCQSRNQDEIVIDRNLFRNTYAAWDLGTWGVNTLTGNVGTIEDAYITNNIMYSTTGWETCIWLKSGNAVGADPGNFRVVNNTCYGTIDRHAALTIGNAEGAESAFPANTFAIYNNIFGSTGGGTIVDWQYTPSTWTAEGNAYSTGASFVTTGTTRTFAAWKTATGDDSTSFQCNPTFVSAPTDVHPAGGDTCALATGQDASAVTSFASTDYEGTARAVPWSIGAYELSATPAGDATNPSITIELPASSATYTSGVTPIAVSGTASDNVGVTSVTWVNDRGGSGTATGTSIWSVPTVALATGANVITVTATDAVANTGTDVITVTYTPPSSGGSGSSTKPGQSFEVLNVSSTPLAISPTTIQTPGLPQRQRCRLRVETGAVRFRDDGIDPTALVGDLLLAGDAIDISSASQSRVIKFIRVSTDSTVSVRCVE